MPAQCLVCGLVDAVSAENICQCPWLLQTLKITSFMASTKQTNKLDGMLGIIYIFH